MEHFCLFVVISSLVAGTLKGQESAFPYSGCQWDNLHTLNCTAVGITTLGEPIFVGQETLSAWHHSLRSLKTIKYINLSYNKILSLHLYVFYKFSSLETLNISNNDIISVSVNINEKKDEEQSILTSLQTLVIDRNQLTATPKGLGKLKSLQTLCLSANKILQIQRDDFKNCTQLQKLDLGDNRIYKIHPDAFRDLRNLKVLRLSSNALVSITPLVFLYSHVLGADIDLSDNMWACDCRILPLKQFISMTSMGARKEWNLKCSTPLSRAGYNIVSMEHLHESCQPTVDKNMYVRRLGITEGQNTSLHCDISDKLGINKVFWWTPHGIILDQHQVSSHYIKRTNNLILVQPGHSDEGLYVCVADLERTLYQVYVQTNVVKSLIRNPRDVQLLNSRICTSENFALAVSLSVVLSFIFAFFLGLFLRPYIEKSWRKHFQSKEMEGNNSVEVYDNEGFTVENGDIAQSRTKGLNTTKNQQCVIELHVPTHSETQKQRNPDSYDGASNMSNTKKVTWANMENASPKVNLKSLMSLIKPISIIAPDSTVNYIVKSPTQKQFLQDSTSVHQKNGMERHLDNPSDHHNEDFQLSGGQTKIQLHNANLQNTYLERNSNSTSDGSDDENSAEAVIMKSDLHKPKPVIRVNDDISFTVNLKHAISLLKPINIIAPDSTMADMPTIHRQNQLLLSSMSRYPRRENMDNCNHDKDIRLSKGPTENQGYDSDFENNYLDTISKLSREDDTSSLEEDSNYFAGYQDHSSEEDHSSDEDHSSNKDAVAKLEFHNLKSVTWPSDDGISTTLNLKHAISLIKPINIVAPDSTTINVPESHKHLFLSSVPTYPLYTKENINRKIQNNNEYPRKPENQLHNTKYGNNYSDTPIKLKPNKSAQIYYNTSSSDDDHRKAVKKSEFLKTSPVTWASDDDIRPKVNLKHAMSLIKPTVIIAPDFTTTDVSKSYNHLMLNSVPKEAGYTMENRHNGPQNNNNEYNRVSERQSENQLHNINFEDNNSEINYSDTSSSDESNDLVGKNNHSPDEDVIIKSKLLMTNPVTLAKDEDICPKVNLKLAIALIKPINIIAPDSEVTDAPKSPNQNQFFLSGISRYPDNTTDNMDNWSHNLAQDNNLTEGQTQNRPHNLDFENNYSDTKSKPSKDVDLISYVSSSSDDESNDFVGEKDHSSDEDAIRKSDLLMRNPVTWASDDDICSKVNLKHSISLIKPINIVAPDSEMTVPKSPKRSQFFPSGIFRYPDNRTDNMGNWSYAHDKDNQLTEGQTQNQKTKSDLQNNYSEAHSKPTKDIDLISYDSNSSDDDSNDFVGMGDHVYNEDAINKSELLKLKPLSWAGDDDISPKVNLKQAISLIKPINIVAPDSTMTVPKTDNHLFLNSVPRYPEYTMENINREPQNQNEYIRLSEGETENQLHNKMYGNNYSDTLSKPKPNKDGTVYYDSSSSDEETDAPKSPKQNQFFLSGISRYPDNTTDNMDNWSHNLDQDNKLTKGPTQNQPQNSDLEINYSDTQSKPIKDIGLISYDSSSSDDESNDFVGEKDHSSDEDALRKSDLLMRNPVTWASGDDICSKVNLKHSISLIKPIYIVAPDSEMTDVPKSPKTSQFFSSGISRYPDSRTDNMGNWSYAHDQDNQLTEGQTQNHSQNSDLENNYSEAHSKPIKDIDLISYDSSSSDDDANDFVGMGDHVYNEDAINKSELLKPKPLSWAIDDDINQKVNLKHALSLIKPINIVAPDSTMTVPKSDNHLFLNSVPRYPEYTMENINREPQTQNEYIRLSEGEPENQFHNKMYGNNYSDTLSKPKHNKDGPIYYNSSSSDEETNDFICEKDHSSDEDTIMKSEMLLTNPVTWAKDEDIWCKVNIKHAISLVKPINIIAPDSEVTDAPKSPNQNHFFLSGISRYPDNTTDIMDNWSHNLDQDNNLTEGQTQTQPHNLDFENNYSDTQIQPSKDVDLISYVSNSSNDESNDFVGEKDHSSDEDAIRKSNLLMRNPVTWASDDDICSKVNLKHSISLIKPINIVAPDSEMTDVPKSPKTSQFSPSGISRYPDNRTDDIGNQCYAHDKDNQLTEGQTQNQNNYSEAHSKPIKDIDLISYDSSSSDEESNDFVGMGDHVYNEDAINKSELLKPKPLSWASDDDISPKVNLKHAISLIKPIIIVAPDSTMTVPKSHNHLFLNSVTRFSEYTMENINSKPQNQNEYIRLSEGEPENRLHNKMCGNKYSDTSGNPRPNKDGQVYCDTSDDDESKDHSYNKDAIMKSEWLKTKPVTWARQEYINPKVNLKHAISLIKPINIIAQDSAMIDMAKFPKQSSSDEDFNSGAAWQGSYEGEVTSSNLLKTNWANSEDGRFKVNLRHIIALIKPINVSSDFGMTDIVKSPMQYNMEHISRSLDEHKTQLSGGQLEQLHDTNHYLGNVSSFQKDMITSQTSYDSSSDDDGSCFSFSQSNSLSDDFEPKDIISEEEVVMDMQTNSSKGERSNGDYSNRPDTPGTTHIRLISGTGQHGSCSEQKGKVGDYFPETTGLSELYRKEWVAKPIVKMGSLSNPSFSDNTTYLIPDFGETSTDDHFNENKTHLIQDFGETSTDEHFRDFNMSRNVKPLPARRQRVASARSHRSPDSAGQYFVKRKKVFDAFSASLKNSN